MVRRVSIIVSTIFLASCATNNNVWYKPNANQQMLAQDRYTCLQQSQQPTSSAYYGNYGGLLQSKELSASSGMVTNNDLFSACMNAQGWRLVNRNSIPTENSGINRIKEIQNQISNLCIRQEYARVFNKTTCATRDITDDMLGDKNKPTKDELVEFNSWSQESNRLADELNNVLKLSNSPRDKQALSYRINVLSPARKKSAQEFLSGNITWGEYNRQRKSDYAAFEAEARRIYGK